MISLYWRSLFYYFCIYLEKINLHPDYLFQKYLKITDILVEGGIPFFKSLGTRQILLSEKP
jgi:hypothetical protein